MADERIRCFVIMPFSATTSEHTEDYWTRHYEKFLKPLIEETPRLEAHRSQALRGDILKTIISTLVVSPIVVADLTDANPNVYWELGVRQSFKHGTITIAEHGTHLPFDIGVKGTLFYSPKDHLQIPTFREVFSAAIADCLSHPDRPDSHVLETISGRGTIYELVRRDEAIRRIDGVLDECSTNLLSLNAATTLAKNNLKAERKQDRTVFIIPLSVAALNLLTTTRYLDRERDFYERVALCISLCTAVNNEIASWGDSPNDVERYLESHEPLFTGHLEGLRAELKEIQQELRAGA